MTNEKFQLLNVRRPPGRLTMEEVGLILGFATHEMRVLMAEKLIVPLGTPSTTAIKYFSSSEIERLRCNPKWLARASDCIAGVWQSRNQKMRAASSLPQESESLPKPRASSARRRNTKSTSI